MRPLLRHLGRLPASNRLRKATVAVPVKENDHRQDYVRARVTRGAEGELLVTPFAKQDSSMMKIFAEAEGLLVRPPNAPAIEAGAACEVLLMREPRA